MSATRRSGSAMAWRDAQAAPFRELAHAQAPAPRCGGSSERRGHRSWNVFGFRHGVGVVTGGLLGPALALLVPLALMWDFAKAPTAHDRLSAGVASLDVLGPRRRPEMATVFVTGSSAGIGLGTADALVKQGHRVVAHARDKARAAETGEALPGVEAVLVGDLASIEETRALAEDANEHGPFDAVVHNAGVGGRSRREVTVDDLEEIFQVNVLAPYVLTALMARPKRLVYLTSGLHLSARGDLSDLQHDKRHWEGMQAYSDSKLWDVMLAFAIARRWRGTLSNAVDPGWIKTKMGGPGAPDPVELGADTPAWLATSGAPEALVTGRFFRRRRDLPANPAAYDPALQDDLIEACRSLSGVPLLG